MGQIAILAMGIVVGAVLTSWVSYKLIRDNKICSLQAEGSVLRYMLLQLAGVSSRQVRDTITQIRKLLLSYIDSGGLTVSVDDTSICGPNARLVNAWLNQLQVAPAPAQPAAKRTVPQTVAITADGPVSANVRDFTSIVFASLGLLQRLNPVIVSSAIVDPVNGKIVGVEVDGKVDFQDLEVEFCVVRYRLAGVLSHRAIIKRPGIDAIPAKSIKYEFQSLLELAQAISALIARELVAQVVSITLAEKFPELEPTDRAEVAIPVAALLQDLLSGPQDQVSDRPEIELAEPISIDDVRASFQAP